MLVTQEQKEKQQENEEFNLHAHFILILFLILSSGTIHRIFGNHDPPIRQIP